MWTILRVLNWTQHHFAEHGLATPRLDAEVLLAHVVGTDRVGLYMHFDQPLQAEELARYRGLIQRRLGGEPVAYLVGTKEFRSLILNVDERVLVPRPETETVVEVVLELAAALPSPRVLEVGTGSGAIALALKQALPHALLVASDCSAGAAEVARANARRLSLAVEVVEGDLIAPGRPWFPFDLVVSNPPYIASSQIAQLAPEVRREPLVALDGGADGLAVVRRLIADAPGALGPGGALVLEVGGLQAPRVVGLIAADARYGPTAVRRDLAGVERVVSACALNEAS